ncbi:hypothetical protein [Geomonas subterranea]|uniref:hypothetical protein n=1 Tax=Geomonas subterranea TaxID=2847989 RepID=UPI001CD49228|nr:hypothetical protein [Geomonas fuzhouensis]
MRFVLLAARMVPAALLLLLAAGGSLAASGQKKLLLFAKNPSTWSIVEGGARGKLVYHEVKGAYQLEASGLAPRAPYALVRYVESPPRGEVLARGVSDSAGRLSLQGSWRNWTSKFWVVSGEDVGGSPGSAASLKAWRPERYLFEEKPLGIPCSCPEPEEP